MFEQTTDSNAFINPFNNLSSNLVSSISTSNVILKTSNDGITSLDFTSGFSSLMKNENATRNTIDTSKYDIQSNLLAKQPIEKISLLEVEVNTNHIAEDPFLPKDKTSHNSSHFLEDIVLDNDYLDFQQTQTFSSAKTNPFSDKLSFSNPEVVCSIYNTPGRAFPSSDFINENQLMSGKSVFDSVKNAEELSVKKPKLETNKDSDLFKDFAVSAFNEFKRDNLSVAAK